MPDPKALEEQAQKARIVLRDRYRGTVCSGCRNNYYNYPKPKSPNGDVAVPEGYSCWHLNLIKNNRCPIKG